MMSYKRMFMDFAVNDKPRGRIVIEFPFVYDTADSIAGFEKKLKEVEDGFKIELDNNGWPIRTQQLSNVFLVLGKSVYDSDPENDYDRPWHLTFTACSDPGAWRFGFTQDATYGQPCAVMGEVVEGNEHIWYFQSIGTYQTSDKGPKLNVIKHGSWYRNTEPFNATKVEEKEKEKEKEEEKEEEKEKEKEEEVVVVVVEKKKRGRKPKAKAPEAKAPETKAPETKAPENKATVKKVAPKPIAKKPVGRPRKNPKK